MRCPICKKDVPPGGAFTPFCSDRCRLIDLGNWATGKYSIPSDEQPDAELEEEGEKREGRD